MARGSDGSGAPPRGSEQWAARNSDKSLSAASADAVAPPASADGGGAAAAGGALPPARTPPAASVTVNVLREGAAEQQQQQLPLPESRGPAAPSSTGTDKWAGVAAPLPQQQPQPQREPERDRPGRGASWCEALAAFFKGDGGGGAAADVFRSLGPVGLGDCLFSFFDWEALTGPDQYFCERCACKRDADKRIGITCLPEVLCVHLKRFSYSASWGGSKNDAAVRFPLEGLDLAPFLQVRWRMGLGKGAVNEAAAATPAPPAYLLPLLQVGAQAHDPHAAACRLYVRAKEQQAGRRLGVSAGGRPSVAAGEELLPPLSTAAASCGMALSPEGSLSSPALGAAVAAGFAADSGPGTTGQRRGGNRSVTRSTSTSAPGKVEVDVSTATRTAGVGRNTGQAYSMSPDTRSWILHRHALATGLTGVEDVTAAAKLAAQDTPEAHRAEEGGGGSAGGAAAARSGGGSGGPVVPVSPGRVVDVRAMGDTRYDLVSVVEHIGGLGGGHYIAHARHRAQGAWFTFDDLDVRRTEGGAVANREAYLLFYVRRRPPRSSPVALPVAEPGEPKVYVSRAWWLRYTALATPGPVTAADILCDHGSVKRQLADAIAALTVAVPLSHYNALAAAYGAAEPPLRDTRACRTCRYESAALSERRSRENTAIAAVDSASLVGDQVGGSAPRGDPLRRSPFNAPAAAASLVHHERGVAAAVAQVH